MKLTTGYKKPIDSDGNVLLAGGGHKTIQQIINDYGSMSITPAITFSQAINADILGNASTADRLKNDKDGVASTGWQECKIENGIIKYYNSNTTYSTATSNSLGLVKIGYAANNKNYPIQLSDDGKMYVHVPWTDTKRDITDSYSGTSSTISLSQKGGKDLYNALVNGYASSAGSSEYSNKLLVGTITSSNATPDKFDSQRITGWIDENANLFNAEKFSGITVKGLNNKYSSFWQLAGYSSTNASTHGIFFREASSDSTWKDWVQIITTENIQSQTVSLAKILSYDNSIKLYAQFNNELNFGGTNNSTTIYFGYRATDSRAIPTSFVFGGSDGSAKITASGFVKKGINDSNVLLGAGGHKALAQFVQTSGDQSISGIKTFNDTIKANRAESTTGFFQTSDFRKKNILGNVDEYKAYHFVKNCKPIVYELKDDKTHDKQLGLIAQEVEEYFPELVITDENGFKSMDYSRLSVVLFTLLKDLIKRNKL